MFYRLVVGLCLVVTLGRYACPVGLSTMELKLCQHEPKKQQGTQQIDFLPPAGVLSVKLLSQAQEATKPGRKHRGLACHSIADSARG